VARRLGDGRRQLAEQVLELRGVRGKSSAKVRLMLKRVEEETAEFERCTSRPAGAARRAQPHAEGHAVGPVERPVARGSRADAVRDERVAAQPRREEGVRRVVQRLRALLDKGQAGGNEIRDMLGASFTKLNAEFGFALALPAGPDLGGYASELALIERSYVQYLGLTQALRLSQPKFMEQFRRMLVSKLRVVFENASGELELWSKGASAQVDSQLRERRRGFRRAARRSSASRARPASSSSASPRSRRRTSGCTSSSAASASSPRRCASTASRSRCPWTTAGTAAAASEPAGQRRAGAVLLRHAQASQWGSSRPASSRGSRATAAMPLPWQATRDPYRVWLSRIMLQQTQVATVLGYYERFLARFPDVRRSPRRASTTSTRSWSGLGYYSRARNLHRCAQAVVDRHGGQFPRTSAQLAELPGIGRSTAAAIAAFCFGERVAILDGNVKRVLTRVLAFGDDLASQANERKLWAEATRLLPDKGIEPYTQGLMDLGATVCLARSPHCLLCPGAHGLRRLAGRGAAGVSGQEPQAAPRAPRSMCGCGCSGATGCG
jgi:A/G-specific adenine glycosylase